MVKYIEIDGIGEIVPRSEYDALAAQIETLRNAAQAFSFSFAHDEETKDTPESTLCRFADLQDAIASTPQQHLAEIKAQAGRDGFVAGVNWVFNTDFVEINLTNSTEAASQYSDSIRQEGDQ